MSTEGNHHSPSPDEAAISRQLSETRARLEHAAGIAPQAATVRSARRPFRASERSHTTLLFGGLTWKHDQLIQGALEALGYRARALPTPDIAAYHTGREYGNNGQCNPTYFTVGNLVQQLRSLEEGGLSRKEICDDYVFFTAGACGPCRFGMYEAEYRLALRNAGFEDFRVLLFQQSAGLHQEQNDQGLALDLDFFMGILYAMMIGDLLGEVAYGIRPYEKVPGDTDRALALSVDEISALLSSLSPQSAGRFGRAFGGDTDWQRFLRQLSNDALPAAMRAARDRFAAIPIDPLRPKPVVKIAGEFWAQTTEGDGNFNMYPFLEQEGAEVIVEPVATWILYMIHGAQNKIRDRKGLDEGEIEPTWLRPHRRLPIEWRTWRKLKRLEIAGGLFRREYARLGKALGGTFHTPLDQHELEAVAHQFYNSRIAGGEGHLEVAKNIYYHREELCHMVLSLKPFGCMPSTQSDGAQTAVQSQFPNMIYLPIETSGEGEINARSRVQMALGEARVKTREEFARALAESGHSLAELYRGLELHPELASPLYTPTRRPGYTSRAARLGLDLGEAMRRENPPRAARAAAAGGAASGTGREAAR